MTRIEAYELGQEANERGEPISANPFNLAGDMRAAEWTNGWEATQLVREDWEHANHERARAA
jgi:hypothetical protein